MFSDLIDGALIVGAFVCFAMLVETVANGRGFASGIFMLAFAGLAFVGAAIVTYVVIMVIP